MTFPERKKIILDLLQQKGKVTVPDLEASLQVSAVTARRDLDMLANENLIERVHGGALHKEKIFYADFQNKSSQYSKQKEEIGRCAAELVQDGDIIFLDCGSTVLQMCPYLNEKKNVRVITNSIPIMLQLLPYQYIKINMVGGELDQDRMAIHGSVAIFQINQYKANKAFIGIDGISLQRGLTSQSEKEQSLSKALAHNAARVFVLCDSSKFEKEAYLKMGDWDLIEAVVTDQQLEPELRQAYQAAGIKLIQPD